jgi:uncharacterized protein (DUF2236 family)
MPDEGYFPQGQSMLRRVHEERAVGLLYGQRALAIGAINPLTFIGTLAHTRARATPFKRLVNTANMFEAIMLGSRAEADEVLRMVDHMHEKVEGAISEDAGVVKAGTPYSARDPELMLWTVAVIADSARFFYELLVRPLSGDERDALWEDYVRFGELFGMPREVAPRSHTDFAAYWAEQVGRPEAHLTEEARHIGTAIMLEIPVPLSSWPAMRVHNLIVRGSLPPRVREMYALRWSRADALAYRAAVAAVRGSRPVTPRRLRRGSNRSFYELVSRREDKLVATGRPVPGALA